MLGLSVVFAAACGQLNKKDQSDRTGPADQGSGGGAGASGGDRARLTGSPCSADAECEAGECITEGGSGWPSGYCSGDCAQSCGESAVCAGGTCMQTCDSAADCRDGYGCTEVLNGTHVCLPSCTSNAQCTATGECDEARGLCALAPESTCDDFKDNDGDGLIDCEDPKSCQFSPSCAPGNKDAGQPCTASSECKATGGDPLCRSESVFGLPAGSCSEFCVLGGANGCSGDAVCVDIDLPSGHGVCIDACNVDADCPTKGYACREVSAGVKVCEPNCTNDDQCSGETHYCNEDSGLCSRKTEDCANGVDDDDDHRIDCQDADCAATCSSKLESACMGAAPAAPSNHDDTTNGTSLFGGSCTGDTGKEVIYTVTPGAAGDVGTLSITLHASADLGVYVRSACLDESTELGCREVAPGGGAESLNIAVQGGQPYSIFVDGLDANEQGPFDLDVSFTAAKCGDGAVVAPEECDDGNLVSGDGCDSTCKIEAGSVCTIVPPLMETNEGDTSGGSMSFESDCAGDGAFERIYTYTPPGDGTLFLQLESETDQGLYVRTTCGDKASEIDCADFNPGGIEEILIVDVKGGVPLYVFVDGYESPSDAGPYTLTMAFSP